MKHTAVIFDLDGVICFTDDYHYQAWKHITDRLGIPFDEKINDRLRGVSRMDSLDILLSYADRPFSAEEKEELAEEKNERYKQLLEQMSPSDLSPQVAEGLRQLRSQGYKLAIGSSSRNTPRILEKLGLASFFDAISDGNNITRSKPDPEVFLKAAGYLGEAPEHCIVVEDAVAGAQAARAAGMPVVCLGDAGEKRAGDVNIQSFSQLAGAIDGL